MKLYRVREAFYDEYHAAWVFEGAVFAMPEAPYRHEYEPLTVPAYGLDVAGLDMASDTGYQRAIDDVIRMLEMEENRFLTRTGVIAEVRKLGGKR